MKGFTLAELLIVFAIGSTVAGLGLSSYSSYNRSQVFGGAVNEFSSYLSTARSRAISQVKPQSCGINPLDGYEVAVTVSGQRYTLSAVCGGARVEVGRKELPSEVAFTSGSSSLILFDVSTGIVNNPGNIVISGFGRTNTVSVDKIGKISTIDGIFAGPVGPTLMPTNSLPTAQPTIVGCSKDYYLATPHCVFVGGNRGTHCDSTCSGATVPTPTATTAPTVPTATTVPTPTTSAPTATTVPTATTAPSGTSDLVVTNVATIPADPIRNNSFQTSVTVKNQGTASTSGVIYIGVYFDKTPSYSTSFNTQAAITTSISSGESQTVVASGGIFTTSGAHTVHAIVDRTQAIPESDETNNVGGPHVINISKNIYNQNYISRLNFMSISHLL